MEREQLEKLSKDYQEVQMQLQSLALQKMQLGEQKEEYKEAQEQLESSTGKVYTEIGGLIVETSKEEAAKALKEKLETAEMRLGMANRQYDEVSKREQSLRSTLTAELGKDQS